MKWIAHILEKYNLSHMPIFGYSVRILQYYKDLHCNNLPIISIESAEISDTCPGCGAGINIARYLRTEQENHNEDYDIASFTCLECGMVYMSKQDNGRKNVVYE